MNKIEVKWTQVKNALVVEILNQPKDQVKIQSEDKKRTIQTRTNGSPYLYNHLFAIGSKNNGVTASMFDSEDKAKSTREEFQELIDAYNLKVIEKENTTKEDSLKYEEWIKIVKEHCKTEKDIENLITRCQHNGLYFDMMSKSKRDLMSSVPLHELETVDCDGEWHSPVSKCFSDDKLWIGRVYRLIKNWKRPEKPKQLMGWDWLIKFPVETVIKYEGYTLVICENGITCVDTTGNSYFYKNEKELGTVFSDISDSNCNVLWS